MSWGESMAVAGLPEEVWHHVFEFLSFPDKLSVRSSCKFFRRVIDRPALWRNSTVYLENITLYNSRFWRILAKRKVSSAVVLKTGGAKEWTDLACRLPWLASLTIQLCCDPKVLQSLSRFNQLRRLKIRQCRCPSLAASLTSLLQLTHISLCEVVCAPRKDIIKALSQLHNLTSLHYHEGNVSISKAALHNILRCLPNLKHLSLKMGSNQIPLPSDYFCPATADQTSGAPVDGAQGLTSLELLNYMDPILSPEALQGIPSLRSLVVQYSGWVTEPSPCHLKTWLSTLPLLSELSISLGYQLGTYASSVPGTVQNLSLKGVVAELKALKEMAQAVPDLMCLHLDLCCHERQSLIAEVPWLFPKLQCLKIRHHNVPETEFLQLAQMPHLKRVVVLDSPNSSHNSPLADLTHKLNLRTNYRVHVIHPSQPKDQNACLCANH